jgi:hypothetical protein
MTPEPSPFYAPRITERSSKEEIIKIFESYDFKDIHGHRLTMCQDFHDLLYQSHLTGQDEAA